MTARELPRTARLHEPPDDTDSVQLARAALSVTRLQHLDVEILIAETVEASGAVANQLRICPEWIEHVWRWGLATVEGRFALSASGFGPEGRPGRVKTVAGRPGKWDVREQQLHVGAGLRWRLAVF